jgi:hypothetical protein
MKSFQKQFTTEWQEFTTEVAEENRGSGELGVEGTDMKVTRKPAP